MEGSFEKIKIEKLPEGDSALNEYGDEVREILDSIDYLKSAIAVEENNNKKMELTKKLELNEKQLENIMIAMEQRKSKLDKIKEDRGKVGNA